MLRKTGYIWVLLAAVTGSAAMGGQPPPPPRHPAPRHVEAPSINPNGGHYDMHAKVTVAIRAERGSQIIYSLDGRNPDLRHGHRVSANSTSFALPPGDVVVKAVAVGPGNVLSPVREARFARSAPPPPPRTPGPPPRR